MTKIVNDCSNCEGSLYCISKPSKKDYKFPEEENQYLMDLECGIWNCHTAFVKLLTENAELKAHCKAVDEVNEKMKNCHNCSKMKNCFADPHLMKECGVNLDKWELAK